MKRYRQRGGYVLLTTLLIIAMVTVLTVGLARHSMNLAVAAIESEEQLQEKWGSASCLRFANSRQSKLLNRRAWDSETEAWVLSPRKSSSVSFNLGSQTFAVRIEDESAKLNINRLHESSGRKKTISTIRKLAKTRELSVALRPLSDSSRRGSLEDEFECWGQVFQNAEVDDLQEAARNLTCWGSGLNFRVADDDVILETLKPVLGSARTAKLIRLLKGDEFADDWRQQIAAIGATDSQTGEVMQLLVDRSTCQSVWVTCISKTRRVDRLSIREQVAGSLVRTHSFGW